MSNVRPHLYIDQRMQSHFIHAGAFLCVSALGVALAYWVTSNTAPAFVNAVWVFYAPAWLVVNAFFGGIHGAPAWAFLPSVIIAVVSQNLLLWLISRWFLQRREERRQFQKSVSMTMNFRANAFRSELRPNPSIEGMPKRLRLLCTPHVKR
jgi:hypothetical protein